MYGHLNKELLVLGMLKSDQKTRKRQYLLLSMDYLNLPGWALVCATPLQPSFVQLAIPNSQGHFILGMNASDHAVGGKLRQVQNGRERTKILLIAITNHVKGIVYGISKGLSKLYFNSTCYNFVILIKN